jgi:hypothetical protein
MNDLIYLYVIHDRVSKRSGPIFEAVNDEVAMRNYQRMFLSDELLSEQDFTLMKIGEYDHYLNVGTLYDEDVIVIADVEGDDNNG